MPTPNLQLYLAPGACSLSTHIALRESGLAFKTTHTNVRQGFPSDLLSLNPKGKVPFLVIDEELVTEVPAIMTAISQLAPEKDLLGKTDMEHVRCYEWMNWISGTLHGQGYGGVLRPQRYSNDEAMFDAIRLRSKQHVTECYAFIDQRLEGREWAVGDSFTAVDAYLLVFWRWGNGVGMNMEEYKNYARVVENVAGKESVKATVKDEGIDVFGM